MYIGHGHLCVCLTVPRHIPTLLHGPGVTWGMVVVHYWANLQSVHGFRCYDIIVLNVKCQRVLVLTPCLVRLTNKTRQLLLL